MISRDGYHVVLQAEGASSSLEWRNDPKLRRWFRENDEISLAQHDLYWKRADERRDVRLYAIVLKDHLLYPTTIGVCGLTGINYVHGTAEWSSYVARPQESFDAEEEAARLLFSHAFKNLRLRRIYADIMFSNTDKGHLADLLGMKMEGRLRGHYFKDGQPEDSFIYGILAEEWGEND